MPGRTFFGTSSLRHYLVAHGAPFLLLHQGEAAQFFPVLVRDAVESFDDLRVELLAGPPVQFFSRLLVAATATIHSVADHRVEGVRHGEDARVEINLFSAQA